MLCTSPARALPCQHTCALAWRGAPQVMLCSLQSLAHVCHPASVSSLTSCRWTRFFFFLLQLPSNIEVQWWFFFVCLFVYLGVFSFLYLVGTMQAGCSRAGPQHCGCVWWSPAVTREPHTAGSLLAVGTA